MGSQAMFGLSCVLLLCAAVSAQKTYDGRNGPHVFGTPGQQVYIRGQNEGSYQVPGVAGTFQNTPGSGSHSYTDERGNTYVHNKNGAGQPATHSISGPDLVAQRGPAANAYRGRRGVVVSRPDRVVASGGGQVYVGRSSRDIHVARPDRTADYGGPGGDFVIQRARRSPQSVLVSRPDRVVASGGGQVYVGRSSRDIHVARPDRTVDYGGPGGDFVIQRARRSPQSGHVSRPDGRSVSYGEGGFVATGNDGRTVAHSRQRRARVQGDNFVARDDQAGVWNDGVSVWKRPDGRTVSIDRNGNVITSGSPNGRGPQRYSG